MAIPFVSIFPSPQVARIALPALSLLLLSLLAGPLQAAEDGRTIEGPVAATVVKVRDGDTIEVEALIWPMQVVTVAVRLRGIDAPELKARCDAERLAAEEARDRLSALVSAGTVQLRQISGDKYFGRVLAEVSAPGNPDLSRRLLADGLVVPYAGKARRTWCPEASGIEPSNEAFGPG